MLSETHLFALLGGLLLLAFVSNRLFRRTRVPDLIVLMLVGVLLGPVFHAINGKSFQVFNQYLGTLALILILFEGGAELQVRRTLRYFPAGILLALAGYALSFFATAAASLITLKLPFSSAVLVGAVLGCTSGTMVLPTLQQLEPEEHVRVMLLIEAALGDVIAVIAVGSLVSLAEGEPMLRGIAASFLLRCATSIAVALLAAYGWSRLTPSLSHLRFGNAATLGALLVIFSATQALGGSGLLAVLIFGLGLANFFPESDVPSRFLSFPSELSFLIRSFFFVLLGLQLGPITSHFVLALAFIVAALVVARLVAVQVTRITTIDPADRELVFWMLPRGLVTAVLALKVVDAKGAQFAFLPDMAFAVILVTNVLLLVGIWRYGKRGNAEDVQQPLTYRKRAS